jgi:hypothetical protein
MAANRHNAQKSTGPRTAAGKRRVALNGHSRGLIAIFHPRDRAAFQAVLLMALTWWEKARRIRNWCRRVRPKWTAWTSARKKPSWPRFRLKAGKQTQPNPLALTSLLSAR